MNKGFAKIKISVIIFVIVIIVGGFLMYTKEVKNIQEETPKEILNNSADEVIKISQDDDQNQIIVEEDNNVQNPIFNESEQPITKSVPKEEIKTETNKKLDTESEIIPDIIAPTEPVSEPEPETIPESEPIPPPPSPVIVTYTNSGFNPKNVTIKQDDTVLFMNDSTHGMWVSVNFHPTHSEYPISTPDDCLGSSFDSCVNITPNNSWSFTFTTNAGTWGYHNHTNAGNTGSVTIEQ
ncbi:hypothetical protein COB55_02260 [Candidatus Wolfebacteria bacterium]|nr:MAG: hypothetical protein COB55_02260 [Candidatus Wolfebacteria bacterium]